MVGPSVAGTLLAATVLAGLCDGFLPRAVVDENAARQYVREGRARERRRPSSKLTGESTTFGHPAAPPSQPRPPLPGHSPPPTAPPTGLQARAQGAGRRKSPAPVPSERGRASTDPRPPPGGGVVAATAIRTCDPARPTLAASKRLAVLLAANCTKSTLDRILDAGEGGVGDVFSDDKVAMSDIAAAAAV